MHTLKKLQLFYPLQDILITQKFGENQVPIYKTWGLLGHNGLDCVRGKGFNISGSNVRASHDGEVTYAGADFLSGYGVVIRTLEQFLDIDGNPQYFKSIYWHLDPKILVRVGQKVKIGDIVGLADSTGRVTAAHLHFGLKPIVSGESMWTWDNVFQANGYNGAVDPEPYFFGISAYDHLVNPKKIEVVVEPEKIIEEKLEVIKKQISILEQLVALWIRLKNLLRL